MRTKVTRFAPLFLTVSLVMGEQRPPPDLIRALADEEFAKREAAQDDLLAWIKDNSQTKISELLKLSESDDDPEVRKRVLQVLRTLADADYLSEGQGYLGILMQEELMGAGKEGIGMTAIRVLDVMKGSPAEKADLKRGDLIISLDGKGWEGVGAVAKFGDSVAAKKPLEIVTLSIQRAEPAPVVIRLKLGKRPVPDLRMAGGDLELLEEQAKERHFKEWLKMRKKD